MALLNVGSVIALFLVTTTYACLSQLPNNSATTLTASLLFFNNVNIFIAICEIILGLNIAYIQADYQKLKAKYTGNEWGACIAYLTMPLSLNQVWDVRTWAKMWSTYALYDPSYQNHESFGFFIDFGNGLSTIPPSVLVNAAICYPNLVSPLFVGCVGLAMYWQVMYGTIIYVMSFVFNKRHANKTLLEVCLFVGVANSLWFFFPIAGIYACVCMVRDGDMSVFYENQ